MIYSIYIFNKWVLFFISSKFACIWIFHWVVFSAWFLTSVKIGKKQQRRISFVVSVSACVWCCEVCTFMLFLIKRGQMNAAFQCIQKSHRIILLGWFQKLSSSLLLAWRYHGVLRAGSILSVLVFSSIISYSHLSVWQCGGGLWVLRTKIKAHYL